MVGAGSNTPSDKGFCNFFRLQSLDNLVFFNAAYFSQQNDHFHSKNRLKLKTEGVTVPIVFLVAHNVVGISRSGVTVSSDGYSFKDAVVLWEMMLFNSLDIPPERETGATL